MMNSTSIKPLRRSGTSIVAMKRLNNTSSFPLAQAPLSAISALSSAAKTKGGNQPSPTPNYIEFPTSPQPPDDHTGYHANHNGTIVHHTHSKHPLAEITLSELFTCSGCKEFGTGRRYACQNCDFQLHHFCALAPPSLKAHPFHGQHQLVFHAKPKQVKAGIAWPRCDVCCKSTKGFTFRCRVNSCNFQMHPCCAMLSTEIKFPNHPHLLKVLPPGNTLLGGAGGGNDQPGMVCSECKKKRSSGRVYSCTVCDYHLHALCAKSMINGLQEYGIKPPEKPNMLGTAARLASQVVIEFIGGLIEGFGEGVGEVLVQNIGRGRRSTNGRRIA
ncbi:uncharacterized protein LOC125855146 [Solanum stenotomum]|uniref:uncharacterized protein LOC125855146 n=1 Tax=Solanum stenotomum TaxID=172797 RepID=UPI0020D08D4D|nr:uncharacterized protein LOC125855146 [Solanum stenotomum]